MGGSRCHLCFPVGLVAALISAQPGSAENRCPESFRETLMCPSFWGCPELDALGWQTPASAAPTADYDIIEQLRTPTDRKGITGA